jgi:dTDP-4-amino-4,6-dideoxygalactose transaminase
LIPFNVPSVPEISKKYALQALASTHHHGDGPFTKQAADLISNLTGGGHVLLTPSCTHALEMASMLTNIGPGDEVILPSYTFTSAATAITKFGATPVFVDVELESKGIDVTQVRKAVTSRTRAISWVNYAGIAPDIKGLQEIAKEFNLILIEDNAHGLGGTYLGKPLGSFGDFATQSFHATKNIQCGEGGALVINNIKFIENAHIIREKGTNRRLFINGEVKKYQWVGKGSSYLMNEVSAAVLLGQLESFEKIQKERLAVWNIYSSFLSQSKSSIQYINFDKNKSTNVSHIFYFLASDKTQRELILNILRAGGINATSHYETLHNSHAGKMFGLSTSGLSNSIYISSNIVRLPIWIGINHSELLKNLSKINLNLKI